MRALPLVALADGALHVGRDVSRARFLAARRPRPLGGGELHTLELHGVRLQHTDEDLRQIATRDFVPQQILHLAEQVVAGFVQRELDAVTLR